MTQIASTAASSAFARRVPGARRIALATFAVALIGAAALAQAADTMPAPPPGPHPAMMMRHGGPGMSGMPGMLPERLLNSVGASAEQKTRIHAILRAAHDDVEKQHAAQRELHQQLAAALAAPQLDAAGAEALRQKLNAGHDAASKRMLQAMLDASAVLTPEQRQKVSEQMGKRRDMMERHRRERDAMDGPRS